MSGYTELATLESSRNCLRRIACHDELQFSKDSIVNVMERFVKTVNVMDETILVPCRLLDRQVGDSTDILPASARDSTANQLSLASSAQGKRGAAHSKNVHEFLHSAELFNLYTMLNSLKNDLLWTGKDDSGDDECDSIKTVRNIIEEEGNGNALLSLSDHSNVDSNNTNNNNNNHNINEATELRIGSGPNNSTTITTVTGVKGHNRRPSNASVASTASVSNMSDAESDISNENDSGIEFEGNKSANILSSDASISGSEDAVANGKKIGNQDKATELARRCRRHLNGLYQCLEQMTEAANYLTARYQSDVGPV